MLEMSSGVSAPTMGLGISHGTGGGEGVAGSCRHRAQSQNQATGGNNSQQQQQQQPGQQQQQQQQQQQLQSSSSQQQSRPQQRPNSGPMGRSKKDNCCLCWCCCCSCSCLARVGGSSTGGGGPSDRLRNKGDRAGELSSGLSGIGGECAAAGASNGLDRLDHLDFLKCCTLEEIRGWGSSFEKLMKSSAGRKLFREFLLSEYSDENIAFWLACEQLKRETDPERIEELARFIYDDYISILSPKEVSLDSRVREIVNRNMVEPTPHIFDEAQLQIYTLMHRDSYPRFVNSELYRNAAKLSSGPPSPSAADNHGSGKSKSKKGQT